MTFYDDSTDERVELSVTTYANWVAKVASLLVEEHDLERGAAPARRPAAPLAGHRLPRRRLDRAGLVVTDDDAPDAVVCGPDGLAHRAPQAADRPVLACSLLPLGVRFRGAAAGRVHDVGADVWSQPDSFIPWDPATDDDAATWPGRATTTTQAEPGRAAAAGSVLTDGGRLLSEANPASPPGIASFTEPLARSASRPGRARRAGAPRDDVRRRARHGPLPTHGGPGLIGKIGRADLVSPPGRRPCPRTEPGPGHRPRWSSRAAGRSGRTSWTTTSACPVSSTSRSR